MSNESQRLLAIRRYKRVYYFYDDFSSFFEALRVAKYWKKKVRSNWQIIPKSETWFELWLTKYIKLR